jgi:DNA polymerase III epsilon subunit family exonuclease
MISVLAMLLAVTGWSFGVVANKFIVAAMGPAELAFVRFATAAAVFWLVLALTRQLRTVAQVGRLPFLMGVAEPALTGMLSIWGLLYTSATHGVVLWAIMPVLAPVMGWVVLRERIGWPVGFGAMLALVGTLILVVGDKVSEGSLFGDALIVASIVCSCANSLMARRIATRIGKPVTTTALQLSTGALIALLVATFIVGPDNNLPNLTTGQIAFAAIAGLVGNAVPFFLYNFAIRGLSIGRVSLFVPLVAPGGTAVAAIWLGEPIGPNLLLALAILLFAVFLPSLWNWWSQRPRPEVHAPATFEPPAGDARLARPLTAQTYIVFDLETTGLSPKGGDQIVAIGAVRLDGLGQRQGEPFHALVNPGRKIPARSTRFHGITDDMVRDAPGVPVALREFAAYCGTGVLVAHNAAFDLKFLRVNRHASGQAFGGPVLDTLLLETWLQPGEPDYSLDALLRQHGIAIGQRHNAQADAEATAGLFARQLARLEERGIATLGDLMTATRMQAEIRARATRF